MRKIRALWLRLRATFGIGQAETELDAELETHLQAGLGLAIGIPVGLLCVRYMQSQLFQVAGGDPRVLTAAIATLALAACAAGLLPARRAARIDPATALRSE